MPGSRRLEAIAIGERLPYDCEKVVEQLRGTPQGCEWLMTRWAMLARVASLGLEVEMRRMIDYARQHLPEPTRIAVVLYVAVALIWFVPDRRIEAGVKQ